jgi:hypothetical protein
MPGRSLAGSLVIALLACTHGRLPGPPAKPVGNPARFVAARVSSEEQKTRDQLAREHRELVETLDAGDRPALEAEQWWCVRGTFGGREVGACDANMEACFDLAVNARDHGVEDATACARVEKVWCFGATRSADGRHVPSCLPSPASCEGERERIEAKAGWSDVGPCMSFP